MAYLNKQIQFGSNEVDLEIYYSQEKGRGIRAQRSFLKNEFVIEYKGKRFFLNLIYKKNIFR